jgi:hypothetical protein
MEANKREKYRELKLSKLAQNLAQDQAQNQPD